MIHQPVIGDEVVAKLGQVTRIAVAIEELGLVDCIAVVQGVACHVDDAGVRQGLCNHSAEHEVAWQLVDEVPAVVGYLPCCMYIALAQGVEVDVQGSTGVVGLACVAGCSHGISDQFVAKDVQFASGDGLPGSSKKALAQRCPATGHADDEDGAGFTVASAAGALLLCICPCNFCKGVCFAAYVVVIGSAFGLCCLFQRSEGVSVVAAIFEFLGQCVEYS